MKRKAHNPLLDRIDLDFSISPSENLASSIVHMVLKWHQSDYSPMPGEQNVLAAMRAEKVKPGYYFLPHCPDMKGLDWPNLTDRYHGLARQARTANEFNHVGAYFLGELAASHLGIRILAQHQGGARVVDEKMA